MKLGDLFVSHKLVEPVKFNPIINTTMPEMIYLNLDRARTALGESEVEEKETSEDAEENDYSWSIGYYTNNHKTGNTTKYPVSTLSDAPDAVKGILTTHNPTNSFNLYNWISRFERSKDFGGKLSDDDLRGIDYKDASGHRTFGYGLLYHPSGKYMDQVKSKWTLSELETLYKQTVDNTRSNVLKWAKSKNVKLKDNQIDALTSAVYNFGPKFLEWSVARLIAANPNDEKIYDAWARFSDSQADKYPGLIQRRKKEADLYFNRA